METKLTFVTVEELDAALLDLEVFCIDTWSNLAVVARLDAIRGGVRRAIGSLHPYYRHLCALRAYAVEARSAQLLSRKVSRSRSHLRAHFREGQSLVSETAKWS